VQLPETTCARARESVSAQLDDELSEPELDRLENHLLVCPECSAWAEQVRDVTLQLRGAPLEQVPGRFVLPRPGRGWRVGSALAIASAAAVVATMFFAAGRQNASPLLRPVPSSDPTYDVAAGVVYPPHPALGSTILAVSGPSVSSGPVPAL